MTDFIEMKKAYVLLLIFILVSCTNKAAIKNSENSNSIVKDIDIKTTRIELGENTTMLPAYIGITYPKERRLIKNSTVEVIVDSDNFRIVPIGEPVKDGEGHFHVWLDSEMKIGAYNNFSFDNISSGEHSITAELVKSDHSSLSPRVTKTISINVESSAADKNLVSQAGAEEFVVEADDYGFYPDNLSVKANDKVRINFKFKEERIYYGGLDIKGPFKTINYKHGGQQPITAEFVASEDTKITSYWPATGIKKADLIINTK